MMIGAEHQPVKSHKIRTAVQHFGSYMSSMVMPNIGAFIAWALLTAIFIPTGWLPNARIIDLAVGPMIRILLPVLIGYAGGRLVHGQRGAVVGAVATIGIAVGSDVPMFAGAMFVGPLTAYLLKVFDQSIGARTPAGFKMLVDNFGSGIIGGAMCVGGLYSVGPAVQASTKALGHGVRFMLDLHMLPLVSVIVEPGKVLFLNNAINHGVLTPIGVAQAATSGQAVEFLIETNPGPGFGILLAVALFSRLTMRSTAPTAMLIQFLGGIHEIYFPYVLAFPRLILAAIAGGAAGVFIFSVTGAGLRATPSPGSIIAVIAVTPQDGYFVVIAGVVISACVSFLIASILLKFGRDPREVKHSRHSLDGSVSSDRRSMG